MVGSLAGPSLVRLVASPVVVALALALPLPPVGASLVAGPAVVGEGWVLLPASPAVVAALGLVPPPSSPQASRSRAQVRPRL